MAATTAAEAQREERNETTRRASAPRDALDVRIKNRSIETHETHSKPSSGRLHQRHDRIRWWWRRLFRAIAYQHSDEEVFYHHEKRTAFRGHQEGAREICTGRSEIYVVSILLHTWCTEQISPVSSPNDLQNEMSPAAALAANPMGHVVRPPSRAADSVDSGLLSLVEHEQYNKPRDSPRYNNPNNVVGIENCQIDPSLDRSPSNSPIDALSDLIASLSNGSDKQSPNSTASAWQVLTFRRFLSVCFVCSQHVALVLVVSVRFFWIACAKSLGCLRTCHVTVVCL